MRQEVGAASEPARKQQNPRLSQVIVGLGKCIGKLLPWGGATDPIPASPMLPGEILWAFLIHPHLLSTYYVPAISHLSLHLAFSPTPFTDEETGAQRGKGLAPSHPSLAQAQSTGEARELWGGERKDREEKEHLAWFPW